VFPPDAVWLVAVTFLGSTVVRLGDSDRARYLGEVLRPYDRRPIVLGAGGAVWGTVSAPLAEIAALLGDDQAATHHRNQLERDLAHWGAPGCARLLPALQQHAG
jgi:hypothetical protein